MFDLLFRFGLFLVLVLALLWVVDKWFGPDWRENGPGK